MASVCSIAMANDSKMGGLEVQRAPATSCILVTVSLISVCVLVVCGVLVVREYTLARNYRETRCHLKNITYYRYDIQCFHCAGLKDKPKEKGAGVCVQSQFPCVRMTVEYIHDSTSHHEALLHPDSLQATGLYSQCSYSVCHRTKEENQRAVEAYVDDWRSRQSSDFFCYYDTDSKAKAIVKKFYGVSDVVHSMLWPSLVVLACSVVFLRIEMRRRGLTLCGRRLPPGTSSAAAAAGDNAYATGSHGGGATQLLNGGELAPLQQQHATPTRATGHGGGGGGRGGRDTACRLVGKTDSERHLVYKSLPSLDGIRVEPSASLGRSSDRARYWFRNANAISVDRYVPEET